MTRHFIVDKSNDLENKANKNFNELMGFSIKPKQGLKYDGVVVTKLNLLNNEFISKVIKRKVKKRIESYLKSLIDFLDDNDDGESLRHALNDITRYKEIIKTKYDKYLEEKYKELLNKKIEAVEEEMKNKLLYMQMLYENYYRNSYDNYEYEETKGKSR